MEPPVVRLPYRERLRIARNYHTDLGKVRDQAGPVAILKLGPRWLVPRLVIVTSPEGIHEVLFTADGTFDKHGLIYDEFRYAAGESLFSLELSRWRPRRKAVSPIFAKTHVSTYVPHIHLAVDSVAASWPEGEAVDLDHECRRIALRAIGTSILGLDLAERADELAKPLRRVLVWITNRSMRPVRAPTWLPTPARRRMRSARAVLDSVIAQAVASCRLGDSDAPFIAKLLECRDPNTGEQLRPHQIVEELRTMVVAGHDTTATTMAYALWSLGRNPALQDAVAQEVRKLPNRPIQVEDIQNLPLTVAAIHESLRMCPPAAAVARQVTHDATIGGWDVREGDVVSIGIQAMHRDPALWTDPETFDPTRFLAAGSTSRTQWQFLPFGAGQRSCIGSHFAMLEASIAVAAIVGAFRIESLHSEFPIAATFTTTADRPIPVRLTKRGTRVAKSSTESGVMSGL